MEEIKLELKLNVSKISILDTDFRPEMLENNQAVVGEIDGKSVLMLNVDLNEITKQVKKYGELMNKTPTRDWFDINDI